jgi:hypothetical protein
MKEFPGCDECPCSQLSSQALEAKRFPADSLASLIYGIKVYR